MTNGLYFRILDMLLTCLGENPTREGLHIYNQFKRYLRKELENGTNE